MSGGVIANFFFLQLGYSYFCGVKPIPTKNLLLYILFPWFVLRLVDDILFGVRSIIE